MLAIIKQPGRPQRMFASAPFVKIQIVRAVKTAQTFRFVFYSMRMYQIHHYGYTSGMGLVYQMFQIIRCTKT